MVSSRQVLRLKFAMRFSLSPLAINFSFVSSFLILSHKEYYVKCRSYEADLKYNFKFRTSNYWKKKYVAVLMEFEISKYLTRHFWVVTPCSVVIGRQRLIGPGKDRGIMDRNATRRHNPRQRQFVPSKRWYPEDLCLRCHQFSFLPPRAW
jgi:hypothetical protein